MHKTSAFRVYVLLAAIAGLLTGVLALHNVPQSVTVADHTAIAQMLALAGQKPDDLRNTGNYARQIESIRAVQEAVLHASPDFRKIPLNTPREPADLLSRGYGECSDRMRTLEKAFRDLGYKTRTASVFGIKPDQNAIQSLLDRQTLSHALVEVHTARGWLVVDTNSPWLSLPLDDTHAPLSLPDILHTRPLPVWSKRNRGHIYPLLTGKFVIIYGLYSRHGRFYPPYDAIPDVNWAALRIIGPDMHHPPVPPK